MKRAVLIALAVVLVGIVWWASGLGRRPADPRAYFTQEQIEKADDYQDPRYAVAVVQLLIGLGVLVFFTSPVGRRLLEPLGRTRWWVAALAIPAVVLLTRALARLPLSFWVGHLREKTYGFSTQTPAGWFGDWAKSIAVSIVVTGVVWLGIVLAMRTLPRAWPAVAAAGAAIFAAVLSFLAPVIFEPIFNRFQPLEDRAFVAELRELADRAGVPVKEVLVADASRRSVKENAYVSGFGSTKRLVLYDTLLQRAEKREVVLVVAHELAHRRERHVELGTVLGASGAAVAILLLWLAMRRGLLPADPGDPRLFPGAMLLFVLLTVVTQPPANWVSRRWELEADRIAIELTGDREGHVATEKGLALRNLGELDPGPLVYRYFFTHPAPAERISLAE